MDSATILGIVLLIVGALATISEIHTLTIYLMAVAIGAFAAAGMAFAGIGFTWSIIAFAVIVILGMPVAHWLRARLKNRESEVLSNDDVGRSVTVVGSNGSLVRVAYRGSTWDARLARTGATAPRAGETYRIASRDGNVLIIAPNQPS